MGASVGKEVLQCDMVKGQYPEMKGDPTNCLFSKLDWNGWKIFVDKEGHGFCNMDYECQKYYFQNLPPTEILMTKASGEKALFTLIDLVGTWIGNSLYVVYCNPKEGLLSGECQKFLPTDVQKYQKLFQQKKISEVDLIEKIVDMDEMRSIPHQRPIVSLNPKVFGKNTKIAPYREIHATFNGKEVIRKIEAPATVNKDDQPPKTAAEAKARQDALDKKNRVEAAMKKRQASEKKKKKSKK